MLGDVVVQEHVGRATGRDRDDRRDQRILGWREIRPPDRLESIPELVGKVGQPIWIDDAVGVGVGDDVAPGRFDAHVTSGGQAHVRLVDDADAAALVAPCDLQCSIGRAVVDDDDLVIRVREILQRLQARVHRPVRVVRADHDREHGRIRWNRRNRRSEGLTDRVVGGFRAALRVDETERPVLDLEAAPGLP